MGSEGAPRQSALFSLLGGFDTRVPCYAGGIDLDLSVEALLSEIAGTPTAPCGLRRSNRPITHNVAGAPDYESGGQEFESLRARQHLATTYRAKIIGLLRYLQGSPHPRQTPSDTVKFFLQIPLPQLTA